MSLSMLTREHKLARSSAGDLVLVAGVFVLALTYLEVPFWNALLFGPAITLQAAVGVVVLTRLLKGVMGSLLLLMGPGLILGGALSFTVFQLVGRGMFGLIAVLALGVGAVATLIKSTAWQPLSTSRKWTIGQILGLAALALSWEFPELLPVATALFVLGFLSSESPKIPCWLARTAGALAFVAVAMVPILRQDYWWLITDDYKFFEVLSLHSARSGPLADWGAGNWARYHWLSYGWSGLLNILGGIPETFTTLTRVMPFMYSVSLGSSLTLLITTLRQNSAEFSLMVLPAWTILSINRLDWSGLSTAGVYAVVAAMISTSILALDTNQVRVRRVVAYLCWTLIVALTKFPSVLAVALVIVSLETAILLGQLRLRQQVLLLNLISSVGSVAIVGLLPILFRHLGGFEIVKVNPGLGGLSETNPLFAALALALSNLWSLLPILGIVIFTAVWVPQSSKWRIFTPVIGLAPLSILAIVLDIKVHGNADNHKYFSGPMYFVSSLTICSQLTKNRKSPSSATQTKGLLVVVSITTIVGWLWVQDEISRAIWRVIGSVISGWDDQRVALAQHFSRDMRTGAVIAFALISGVLLFFERYRGGLLVSALLISLSATTFVSEWNTSTFEISRDRVDEEVDRNLGTKEVISASTWIRDNTNESDLIATNYLYDYRTERPLTDFAFGAWSEREFLVLGPTFYPDFDSYKSVFDLSNAFGAAPSATTMTALANFDVKWYVVDRWNTKFTKWQNYWNVVYENERFLIVKL